MRRPGHARGGGEIGQPLVVAVGGRVEIPEQLAVQLGIVLSPAPPSVPESAAVPTPTASVTATATQPLPVAIDKLEQAFAQLLSGDRPVEALAEDLRLPVADLERLFERYRAAGRLALGLPQEPPHDGGPA